jgi:hypothetical protein
MTQEPLQGKVRRWVVRRPGPDGKPLGVLNIEVVPAEAYDRLHVALERIRDHGNTHDEPCWAIHNGDCADKMQEIARAALEA